MECIRFRNDIQEDIFEYIVERYNASQERQLGRLMQYARALRVERQAMDMVHKEGAGISVFKKLLRITAGFLHPLFIMETAKTRKEKQHE